MEKLFDLFPLEKAVITENGLFFNGEFYTCSIAIKEQWYLPGEIISNEISIYVDSYDDEYILVLLKDSSLTIAYKINKEKVLDERDISNYQEKIRFLKHQLKKRKRAKK